MIAGQGEVVLKSDTNTPCIVIAAFDTVRKIGALAHAMFMRNDFEGRLEAPMILDASHAVDEMISDMTLLGAARDDIEVCVVSGENIPHEKEDPVYTRNITTALEVLKQRHIKIRKDTVNDIGKSHVSLDIESGRIICA